MTTREDTRANWRPLLSGGTAQEAIEAVDAIAEAIASTGPPAGEPDPSLCRGQAGLALLYTWLSRSGRAPEADLLAWQFLEGAVDGVSTQPMNPSLWGGFTGVAWAAELVDLLLDPDAEDRDDTVDDALLRLLSRDDLRSLPYDLVVGLTGLGVYCLQRFPRPTASRCLDRVLDWLEVRARHDEQGLTWWTPVEEILSPDARQQYPTGRGDLGVAHGIAGPIALLGTICGAGVDQARAQPLLDGAVDWLLAQTIPTDTGRTFPLWAAPGYRPYPARSAWCYGDPGIAAALLIAARGAGNPGWERHALDLACRAAARSFAQTGVVDACICHGSAGLAHIYNRMYQATGQPELAHAATYWVERTLDFYRLARRTCGDSWVQGSTDPARPEPWTGLDVVDGAAGVALVLLAATTSVEPLWDRMFLLSGPGAATGHAR